jgi:hypothetical protein
MCVSIGYPTQLISSQATGDPIVRHSDSTGLRDHLLSSKSLCARLKTAGINPSDHVQVLSVGGDRHGPLKLPLDAGTWPVAKGQIEEWFTSLGQAWI